jgi:hypothetical protein
MADNITIIRLEVEEIGAKGRSKTAGAAAAVATGAVVAKDFMSDAALDSKEGMFGSTANESSTGTFAAMRYQTRLARKQARGKGLGLIGEAFKHVHKPNLLFLGAREGSSMFVKNIEKSQVRKGAALGLVAVNAFHQHKTIGYNLSGASHSAQVQQRKRQVTNRIAGIGLAAMYNPWIAVGMVAHRAWELAQTNRQEIYAIKSSQIIANVMQERLVKDTMQRRF